MTVSTARPHSSSLFFMLTLNPSDTMRKWHASFSQYSDAGCALSYATCQVTCDLVAYHPRAALRGTERALLLKFGWLGLQLETALLEFRQCIRLYRLRRGGCWNSDAVVLYIKAVTLLHIVLSSCSSYLICNTRSSTFLLFPSVCLL